MMPHRTGLALLLALTLMTGSFGCGASGRSGRNQPQDAERHLQAVIDVGLVAIRTGDYAKALQSLTEADRLSPQNADVKHHLGRAYYQLGDMDKAVDYYNQALAIDPTKTDIHNNLGLVYLNRKEYDQAREQFQICINDLTYSNAGMSRYNMGLLEESTGNRDKAATYYHQIISSAGQTPAATPAYYRLAYIEFQKGDYRASVDYLTAAVRLNPDYADAFFLLGESYEKMDLSDEAAEAYGRCVVLDPVSMRGVEAQKRVRNIMKEYH
jgi:Tfp pilus assembly protein PilF